MDRQTELDAVCRAHRLLAVYLFGSRGDEGLALLRGDPADGAGSDLDVGILFQEGAFDASRLSALQVAFEDLFTPLRVDLVPLERVDALFQYRAIAGHRIAAPDSTAADFYELLILRRAAELLPIQRRLEQDFFGVSTS